MMATKATPQQIAEMYPRVAETIDFPKSETEILKLWQEMDVFNSCQKQSANKPKYSFYDGPPFATGLPHYGHILAGTIKDTVTRYAHQQGFHVPRRFGWDCHGLPVEYEIDKVLGIKGPDDVMKMGIANYNAECRKIVGRYVGEWEQIMGRLGRWIDFKNDYKTMYPWFMESIWWVFSELYKKGLVYQGNKVMPYSTACNTPLSNFESGQNYKDVVDPAVTVTLPLVGDADGASLLVWTTTPWTLPSNLAACVHPTHPYVRVKQLSTGKIYVVMEARLASVFKPNDFEVHSTFPGNNLKGLEYTPIFNYFPHMHEQGAFRVLVDEYVTTESGTGIVHQAAYFGEDDYRVCLAAGVITRDQEPICPLDASGCFTAPVTDFLGQYIKDADKNIVTHLRNAGRLFHHTQMKHSYPFCWRSDTPLIYRAVPSWFIRVEHMSEALLRSSADTYWVPDFVKDKRFGNWLREARDWAVSRNRYWGTPMPIWMSPSGDEVRCIGSIKELEQLTGVRVTDLHRESIDHLEIPSAVPGKPPLKRISEVFDCWFESGSMPYAQQHYPFERQREFEDIFPADFIAEGIDQTRGWFYTLIVLSTALFGRAPFKNLIANGLVLAADGQKMSKRKKNYPDPLEVVNKYGADALRLYLISSPVVRAENLRFKEEGVRDIIKDVFLPWYNAFRFLMQNVESWVVEHNELFVYRDVAIPPVNFMDQWILSFTQSLLDYVRKEMALYHLYTVVPRLTKYIDFLTNWYVRMNRKRLKGEGGKADCTEALLTLFNVLLSIVRMMAPFAPFLAEWMYQHFRRVPGVEAGANAESVHYLMLPEPNQTLIKPEVERSVSRLQAVIENGRILRDRNTLPIKVPLPEVIIIHQEENYLADIVSLKEYVLTELNVRDLTVSSDKRKYGVQLRAEPDYKSLGVRLKGDVKAVGAAVKQLTDAEIGAIKAQGYTEICGHRLELAELKFVFSAMESDESQYVVEGDSDVLVLLNITPDKGMVDEGVAREVMNRIQKLRKKAKLVPTDQISVQCCVSGDLLRICTAYAEFIESNVRATFTLVTKVDPGTQAIIMQESQRLRADELTVALIGDKSLAESSKATSGGIVIECDALSMPWVNVVLASDVTPRYCNDSRKATLLLEAAGGRKMDSVTMRACVQKLFGLHKLPQIFLADGTAVSDNNIAKLKHNVVYVTYADVADKPDLNDSKGKPFISVVRRNSEFWLPENPVGVKTKN